MFDQTFAFNRRTLFLGLLVGLTPLSCGESVVAELTDEADEGVRIVRQAVGEPVEGYPNYAERVVLYLTNRARSEPSAFNPEPTYLPTPPLRFDTQLAKASRWQAQHIIQGPCWCEDHSSCCEIGRVGDEMQCMGAVTGCSATSVGARVAFWSTQYSGENAAMGYPTPHAVLDGWIFSPGHWANINESSHTLLGPGQWQGGWVQVFGRDGRLRPVIEDGIHFSSGSSHTFATTYFQLGNGGPRTALVIVNGVCHDLALAYGQPEHGAFEKTVNLEPGCHRYYFHFTDGNGDDHVYPSTGSLGVAVGDAGDCPLYAASRPADSCSPSGQPCEQGQTRHCYTGPFGTEGVGQCKPGTERCVGAQWSGMCNNQVLPAEETCGNRVDENCNGQVDEGCPVIDFDDVPDIGGGDEDAREADAVTGPEAKKRRDDAGVCAISALQGAPREGLAPWSLALAGLLLWRSRRRRSGK
ncbi:MAG: CAP domain-containing protein [Bradymonadaceae bacterium]|nr:CAP domain-containing protein [Lujinxingiaceae bacterium]